MKPADNTAWTLTGSNMGSNTASCDAGWSNEMGLTAQLLLGLRKGGTSVVQPAQGGNRRNLGTCTSQPSNNSHH